MIKQQENRKKSREFSVWKTAKSAQKGKIAQIEQNESSKCVGNVKICLTEKWQNSPKITIRCHFGNVAGSNTFLTAALRALYGLTIYFHRAKNKTRSRI